jgi:hypothetical protein
MLIAGLVASCSPSSVTGPAVLTQLLEARRLASELHVEFTKAADAANRAVMADTDEASAAAADEARRARQIVERNVGALKPVLQSLGYRDDERQLEEFETQYAEYRRLDDEILPLTIENTNLKAQRMSFGPSREAGAAFRDALEAAVRSNKEKDACCSDALARNALAAVREIQILYAPHIAEAEDAAMTRMEAEMSAQETTARQTVAALQGRLGPGAASSIAAASAALDRFMIIHKEIIALSRRNSEVRSLALSLGRKRTITAYCEDRLRALEATLAKHQFTATR